MKKRIPNLNGFVFESKFLYETKAGRGASKLQNIDNLFSWMYDHDVINKSEKNKKDSVFHQYYRYYNDGDFPKSLQSKGLHKYSKDEDIELALEEMLEEFIKTILAKYQGKYNRTEFRCDIALNNFETLKSIINDKDFYSLLNYWSKEVPIKDSEFAKYLELSRKQYDKLRDAVNDVIKDYPDAPDNWGGTLSTNRTINSTKEALEEIGLWDNKLEKLYQIISSTFEKMEAIVDNVIIATQKTKEIELKK